MYIFNNNFIRKEKKNWLDSDNELNKFLYRKIRIQNNNGVAHQTLLLICSSPRDSRLATSC